MKEKIKGNSLEKTKTRITAPAARANNIGDEDSLSPFFDLRHKKGQILFFVIIAIIAIIIRVFPSDLRLTRDVLLQTTKECEHETVNTEIPRSKYWLYGRNVDGGHLKHVNLVLNRLGLQRETQNSNWDLLWAHDYPFTKLKNEMKSLKMHQRVNHFPGTGYITNKIDLVTSDLEYIPKSFRLPNDTLKFEKYAAQNKNTLFVQKHNQHRHIYIRNITEIDFGNNDTFIQEFVDDPLLVDGHKFDIGVYTIITSINPLRVYIYKGDILFRYCPLKYYPFDSKKVDKYIVGDDYLPTWEVPALSNYYNNIGLGMKASFDAYMNTKKIDTDNIWQQVEDAIRIAILAKEPLIVKAVERNYKYSRNFFELMRFDLVIDNKLRVHLMEANMSPNLSSEHYKPNTLLYEQVLYHTFNLVGIGTSIERNDFTKRSKETEMMLSTHKNIMVNGVQCSNSPCNESCAPVDCQLCSLCLQESEIDDLHMAYREHMNKGDTKRIFPVPMINADEYNKEAVQKLSEKNQLMSNWFHAKCTKDITWCS